MKIQDLISDVKLYLEAAPEERDLQAGALMVLQLTNNRIMYNNFIRRPQYYASRIEYELKKKYNFYLRQITHEQVAEMSQQVNTIVEEHHLTKEPKGTSNEEFKKGKRADHDSLPPEIQALYAQNLSIMQQMRRCHTQLQLLSTEHSTCPDSERYPFLKELIDLDKQYHANWDQYDHYALDTEPAAKEEEPAGEGTQEEQPKNDSEDEDDQPKEEKPKAKAKASKPKSASKPKAKTAKSKAKA